MSELTDRWWNLRADLDVGVRHSMVRTDEVLALLAEYDRLVGALVAARKAIRSAASDAVAAGQTLEAALDVLDAAGPG